jgi:penicillin-binding protein 1A
MIPATPGVGALQHARNEQPSLLLSADGRTLATFRQVQQEWVDLDHISPYVIKALIATEDRRFYEHDGIDLNRTLAAIFHTAGGETQGGSTITQQLARNIFPEEIGRSRTVTRKLKEIITALKIERAYSKNAILETYLNTVPFLYNVTGIEMAARTYFGKPAIDLDAPEAATLVGMLKGTSFYNPVVYPDRAQKRRNLVLAQMVKHRDLTEAEYKRLAGRPLALHFSRQQDEFDDSAPHFTAYVRRWLNEWAQQNDIDLSADGLVIHTTIDLTLQQAAMRAVERQAEALQQIADVEWSRSDNRMISNAPSAYAKLHKRIEPFRHFWSGNRDLVDSFVRETPEFRKAVAGGKSAAAAIARLRADADFMARLRADKTRLEAGFIAMDPATGEIKAWVGSRDFNRDQFDHVAQAARQPGSTFKPVVYGAALELGFSPERSYVDRIVEIRAPDGSIWKPTDMSAPTWQSMSLREGLIYSKNTITAQVMRDVGLPSIINLAQSLGINRSRLDAVPSLALGTSPVTLLEMVSAYSTIATTGEYRRPLFVKRVTDRSGKVLAEFENEGRRVMTEDSALELIDMMRGVINRGTGTVIKTRFGILADIAGKTGTTQNNTDGWFILMHPNLVAGAWVGFNDARVTMRSNYWGQGGHNAALVVGDFFRDTLKAKLINPKARFPLPKRVEMLVRSDEPFPLSEGDSGNPPPGVGIITRSDGIQIVIGTPESATAPAPRPQPVAPPPKPAHHSGWENNTLFEPDHN